jgi:curved DNA-binding protein CbpA
MVPLDYSVNPCTWLSYDEQFKAITAAHNLLMDPYLRSRYHLDKDLEDQEVVSVYSSTPSEIV